MTCAFADCAAVSICAFPDGCVVQNPRFVQPSRQIDERDPSLRDNAPKLVGTKPSRTRKVAK